MSRKQRHSTEREKLAEFYFQLKWCNDERTVCSCGRREITVGGCSWATLESRHPAAGCASGSADVRGARLISL
jgi:hypothetical protein